MLILTYSYLCCTQVFFGAAPAVSAPATPAWLLAADAEFATLLNVLPYTLSSAVRALPLTTQRNIVELILHAYRLPVVRHADNTETDLEGHVSTQADTDEAVQCILQVRQPGRLFPSTLKRTHISTFYLINYCDVLTIYIHT